MIDVDLTIRPGECVALVGESGSGKSVTARSLLNLAGEGATTTARRFEIKGRDVRGYREADWRKLRGTVTGLVMQDALVSLDPLRTIGQEVAEVISSHGILTDPDRSGSERWTRCAGSAFPIRRIAPCSMRINFRADCANVR